MEVNALTRLIFGSFEIDAISCGNIAIRWLMPNMFQVKKDHTTDSCN